VTTTFPEFGAFFRAAHGVGPFPWQQKLAELVADSGWPEAFQVPTGLGKTAVLDVAVWALARDASEAPSERVARRRTFLVVDRRLVVDQAYDRAAALAEQLEDTSDPTLAAVGEALRTLAEPDTDTGERLLEVVRMRGGATWASRWLRRPDLPAIVVGTVDQLGSRALFRGYGVGDRRRPIDAALVAADALVIIDEVHLSRAFLGTMRSVAAYESRCERRAGRPLQLVQMSATLPEAGGAELIGDADWQDDVAGPRLRAKKLARLVETEKPKATQVFADLAREHLAASDITKVAVIVNTVGLARAVFDQLNHDGHFDCVLLIGRVRPVDRQRLHDAIEPFLMGAPGDDRKRVLVATQTVEVGVDLDVDALVTQLAPLDSLVQRLGRLDRAGRRGSSDVTVVRVVGTDPVYGPPSEATWAQLLQLAGCVGDALAEQDGRGVDLGTEGLHRGLDGLDRSSLVATTAPAPVVLPQIVDIWARTSPVPYPDELVAPYLHGLERASAVVSVAWRAVDKDNAEELSRSLAEVPVRSDELVEVPLWELAAFLDAGTLKSPLDMSLAADVATAPGPMSEGELRCAALRLAGDQVVPCRRLADIRPGDTVVVGSAAAGYDSWGWTGSPSGQPASDVADLCRPFGTLRLQRAVMSSLGIEADLIESVLDRIAALRSRSNADALDELVSMTEDDVGELLTQLEVLGFPPAERAGALAAVRHDLADWVDEQLTGEFQSVPPLWLVRWRTKQAQWLEVSDAADLQSSSGDGRVELTVHSQAVRDRAATICCRLGFDEALTRAVEAAALAHDLGKADPRFQVSLWHGDRLMMEADGRVLAKSGGRSIHTGDWPAGMRHEAVSATVLGQVLDELSLDVDRDLVAHLVLSHHGYGRPLMPPRPVRKETPFSVDSPARGGSSLASPGLTSQVDWEGAERFHDLCRSYGWWGLALLEAVVRSADVCASEEGT
jgi:CRISPR-associated endonuclease/helicase Cas3